MTQDNLSISLPKGSVESIIDAHIKGAVAAVLAKNPEALVARVVEAALTAKDHYSRETVFQQQVTKLIQEAAADEFKKWLDEARPMIAKQVRAKFDGSSKKLIDQIAEQIAGQLTGNFRAHVSFDSKDGAF